MSPFRRILLIVAVTVVVAATISLGRWQLRRLHARRARNALVRRAQALPPLLLPKQLDSGMSIDSGRRIIAEGTFDDADQLVLRGRASEDGPGIEIVTPFLLDSGRAVLWVLRGFVRSADAVTPPVSIPASMAGVVTIQGIAYRTPLTADSGHPLLHQGLTTWQQLDRGVLKRREARSLPAYLLLAGGRTGPGRLQAVAPAPLTDGPHLSYAIQWFGIGLAVLVFGIFVLWRDGRILTRRGDSP